MESVLQQRFFRLLSEYSQRTVSVSELAEAIEELATHVAVYTILKVVGKVQRPSEDIETIIIHYKNHEQLFKNNFCHSPCIRGGNSNKRTEYE